ncbi:uncharacterized protein LOC101745389 isoform X2 [Bombyx mori]|uniref:uncharacterized protein LOC101745389 isoform X2 n=1 Tax=Bombyx mori TaxID=7091 RepID=UPI002ED4DA06
MKVQKKRSEVSVSTTKSCTQVKEDIPTVPLDQITVKILKLRSFEEIPSLFHIKVVFFDQLLINATIEAIGARETMIDKVIAQGTFNYDPSDYEKMCLFANYPLTVSIQSLRNVENDKSFIDHYASGHSLDDVNLNTSVSSISHEVSCCNVDILPIFVDKKNIRFKKRMEPIKELPLLERKSWETLPLVTIEISATRDQENVLHHKILKQANFMQLTLIASHNMPFTYDNEHSYTAVTKMPISNELNSSIFTFHNGYRKPKRFNFSNFIPNWESLRAEGNCFSKTDIKLFYNYADIQNEDEVNLTHYLKNQFSAHTVTWASFHRTLLLQNLQEWFFKHLRQYSWPFEIHISNDRESYDFAAPLNLFKLLYPGETTVVLAVPLQWTNADLILEKCGCDVLLSSNEKVLTPGTAQKANRVTADVNAHSSAELMQSTGSDGTNAFVMVEVKLWKPLRKIVILPSISNKEINAMLEKMEEGPDKRECGGRGQLDRNWQSTIITAANSLRRVPYYGMTEICAFNRQLSETRTRAEIATSFWQEAAVYVNNNFVVKDYLASAIELEEMLMMAHVALLRVACDTLVGVENRLELESTLRAARQARQMQDPEHAITLFLQAVSQKPLDANLWRELSISLMDINKNWANVCINKSIQLNPRDPITLLCKGSMLLEEDHELAEPFFEAILSFYPYWSTVWVIASAYYIKRGLFEVSDKIMEIVKKIFAEALNEEPYFPRAWDREFGDWWDNTPLLPGMSRYYDAADFLLRIRAISLAEVCTARGLIEAKESAAYFHLLALCCRLKGNIMEALCHTQQGIERYGEINYLRSLEAECYYKLGKRTDAIASFDKAGCCIGAYRYIRICCKLINHPAINFMQRSATC